MAIIDLDRGLILDANEAAIAFYGYAPEELAGLPISTVAMLTEDVLEARIAAVRATRQSIRFRREPHRLKSGEVRVMDAMHAVLPIEGRTIVHSVYHDVTELAAAEQRRDLLATAVEQAVESVVITDVAGVIEYVNPAFERTYGYARAEAVGQRANLLRSGAHDDAFFGRLWATIASGGRWAGDIVNRRRDGTLYTEEATITPVYSAEGRLDHYVVVTRDVTQERADRDAGDRLAAAVDAAADAVYAVALDGTVTAWNAAGGRIFGWEEDEVVGRSIFEVAAPEEHDSIRDWLRRASAGETLGPADVPMRARDGSLHTMSVVAAPVRSRAGTITGVSTVARDVTAERALAAEREVLERQLAQAQKMEAIGRLTGGIAHDFNNLLTAIRGYASLAATRQPDEDLDLVIAAADRAADLTRRLLAFSRATPLSRAVVDLYEVLRDGFKLVSRLVPERIHLQLDAASGCRVEADPMELEQIVLNLVVNAVEATPGAGEIRVATTRSPAAGAAVLTVVDTGCGMDEATLARIFEPFFTTKGEVSGTGLGLATVHGIVERLGGHIDVRSSPGRGTTFVVTLPATDAALTPPLVAIAADVRGSGHVLLVEDDPLLLGLAARMLRSAGYAVSTAAGPAEALEHDLDGIDVIVTDVIMPAMSGPEMVARLGSTRPVVYVSGYAPDLLVDVASQAAAVLVEKPYTRETLVAAVCAALAPSAGSS